MESKFGYRVILAILLLTLIAPSTQVQGGVAPTVALSHSTVEAVSTVTEVNNLLEEQNETGYLLVFPVPTLEEAQKSAIAADAVVYFRSMLQPALEKLRQLEAEGKIARIEEDIEAWGIKVWLTALGSPQDLRDIPNIAEIRALEESAVCSASPASAAREVLQAAQAQKTLPAPSPTIQAQAVAGAAAPTIRVYISSYVSYGTQYSYIHGGTAPNIPVTIRVETKDGDIVVEKTVISSSYSSYSLSPSWRTCEGYGWTLAAGQKIIVTANGYTAVMQIPVIQATANADADIVQGQTAPYRDMMVGVRPTNTICEYQYYTATVKSAQDGTFQFNLAAQGGFDHSGSVSLYVYDSNKNYVYTPLIMPRIAVRLWQKYVNGYVSRPGSYIMVKLRRNGGLLAQQEVVADASGYFSLYFTDMQANDRIEIESNGQVIMSYDIAPQNNILVDWQNGRITGATTPGRIVKGSTYLYCGGSYNSACDASAANVSGNFTLLLPSAMLLRDSPDIQIYDSQGHYQYEYSYYSPYVQYTVYPNGNTSSYSYVSGYWYPGYTTVNIRVYDGATVEAVYTPTVSSKYLSYSVYVNRLLPAGRRIEVTDGIHTRNLTVQTMTARLNSANDLAIGIAPVGRLLDVWGWHYNPDDTYYWGYYAEQLCNVPVNSDGSYQTSLSTAYRSWLAQDYLEITSYESDGDRLKVYGYDLRINVQPYSGAGMYIQGARPNKEQPVTVEVRDAGGTLRGSNTDSDIPDAWYYAYFGFLPQVGDRIWVVNGAHIASFTIPPLTVNESAAENRLYGVGPASKTVYPFLYLNGRGIYWRTNAQVQSGGAYSASFDRIYPTSNYSYGCGQTTVGGCRQSGIAYYSDIGYLYTLWRPSPAVAGTDKYDTGSNDNVPEQASWYIATQPHTFHARNDIDWVAYNVQSANVGRVHSFQTLNLGDIARTSLYLYDSDRTTLLATYTGPDDAGVIRWTPTHAGLHYIKITPRSYYGSMVQQASVNPSSVTGGGGGSTDYYYCGATYDFRVRVEAEWTALIYMNGDSDLGLWAGMARSALQRAVKNLTNVNVVLLWDGTDTTTGDTWRYLVQANDADYQDGENRWYMGELNLGDGNVLAGFLQWGMERYPANHYYVVIADHGLGHSGLSWDFNSYPGENAGGKTKNFANSDRLEPLELREALQRVTQNGARRIDILHYDACLMGLWEHAYQVKDFANYLIFSQNEGWSVFAFDRYVRALIGHDTRAVASEIARLYSERVIEEEKPYTISVIALGQMATLRQTVDQLSTLLETNMNTYKQQIQTARNVAQHLDSNADVALTEQDSYLDLYDFAKKVKEQIANVNIQNAATAVQNAVQQSVAVEYHQAGIAQDREGKSIQVNLLNTHGLSTYFPVQSGRLFSIYAGGQMFQTTTDSKWDEALIKYYGAMGLPPTLEDPDDINPWIWRPDIPTIYLPMVLKSR